jgi:1,4-dihydroxy-2-naphthoate octaprenyltransferase
MDSVALLAVAISTGIFATTIQTQDFKDCDGDRRIGRQTLPIVLPELARYTLLPILLIWSMGLSVLWNLSAPVAGAFIGLALLVALRYITMRDLRSDQVSFYIYNVCFTSPTLGMNAPADLFIFKIWLSAAHSLPGYWRSYHGIS